MASKKENVIKVTISILTFNRAVVLKKLLKELKGLNYSGLEVIVIDNCSSDNTASMIKKDFNFVKYFCTSKNIGADARNIGLKNAEGSVVITLDDDISGITDEDIIWLVDFFEKKPKLGALNFKVINFYTGKLCNWVHHCDPSVYSESEFKTYEITEGAVAFSKKALNDSGFYPEGFFLSHEGPDLAFRLINSGYDVIYSNQISVFHSHSNIGRKSWTNYYYDTRNQFFLSVRNFPVVFGLKYLVIGLSSMMVYSIRDGYFYYWLKGVVDGVLGMKNAYLNRQILTPEAMALIKDIGLKSPGFFYQVRSKLFNRGARL